SPFAFTGNKFEFRMVGSSQSVAAVNTMLNAIMAEEYDQMAAKLDAGESLDDIIREFFKNHERIIFNGDGYSEEWKEEAARRGLPNHANSV
ncbi:glutamine synthetase type III, partial [Tyzzerella nexilis]|nr:glutamine synthetase type III [[Clostridium] nexile]